LQAEAAGTKAHKPRRKKAQARPKRAGNHKGGQGAPPDQSETLPPMRAGTLAANANTKQMLENAAQQRPSVAAGDLGKRRNPQGQA